MVNETPQHIPQIFILLDIISKKKANCMDNIFLELFSFAVLVFVFKITKSHSKTLSVSPHSLNTCYSASHTLEHKYYKQKDVLLYEDVLLKSVYLRFSFLVLHNLRHL